jgi:arabinose-5-phosphate isomerase
MSEVIFAMTGKRFGCVGLLDGDGGLAGIITDGDLRRHWADRMQEKKPAEIMTRAPRTAPLGALASSALEVMNRMKITVLFIVAGQKPVGILHIHDLLRAGVA